MSDSVKNDPKILETMWNQVIQPGTPEGAKVTHAEAEQILDAIRADGVTDAELQKASQLVGIVTTRLGNEFDTLRAALDDDVVAAMKLENMDDYVTRLEGKVPAEAMESIKRLAILSTWADQALRIVGTVRTERALTEEASSMEKAQREAAERIAPAVASVIGNLDNDGVFNTVTDGEAAAAAKTIWESGPDSNLVIAKVIAQGEKDGENYIDRLLDEIDAGDDKVWLGRLAQTFINHLDEPTIRKVRDKLSPDSFAKLEQGAKLLDAPGQEAFKALFLEVNSAP